MSGLLCTLYSHNDQLQWLASELLRWVTSANITYVMTIHVCQ